MEKYNYKKFTLCDRVNGYLNLNSGNITTELCSVSLADLALPLNVAHIHKANSPEGSYGKGWHLSLNKQLKLSQSDNKLTTIYTYTDELGDTYTFDEKYYVFEGAERVIVDKNEITIDINGNLTYNNKKVYKHQSCNGYTLIPEINDYINSELIKQKQDEEIELEDYIRQQEPVLRGYVIVNSESGAKISGLSNLNKSAYDQFVSGLESDEHAIIVTKSKAIKLRSLYKQYNKLSDEDEKALINEQITELISQAQSNLPVVKEEFRKYFGKKAEYEQVLLQTPVAYLRDESGIISGFNKNGNLVLAANSYGNYVGIGYDSENRIASIYDSNNKVVNFEYKNGLLQSITDSRGRKVMYAYDSSDCLITVTYPDGKACTVTYTDDEKVATVTDVNGNCIDFAYEYGKLWYLLTNKTFANTDNKRYIMYFGSSSAEIISDKREKEKYTFNSEKKLTEYRSEDELDKTVTKYITYENDGKKVTVVTYRNTGRMNTVINEYDDFDLLIKETKDWVQVAEKLQKQSVTTYSYDANNRLTRKVTVAAKKISFDSNNTQTYKKTYIENYSYDSNGNLTLTESYLEEEKKTSGINFEERVYNDDGHMIKCIRWNSLDSSTKFYEEYEREKDGKVKYEKDETGAYSAMYEYVDGTNVVNSVTYANGGRIAYGRNPYDNQITSVTASTADGEASTNNTVYENGLPVKVTSGNTTLEYKYDDMGRKTEVKVNGEIQSTFVYDYECFPEVEPDPDDNYQPFNIGSRKEIKRTGTGNISLEKEIWGERSGNIPICETEKYKVNGTLIGEIERNEKGLTRRITDYTNVGQVHEIQYLYNNYGKVTYAFSKGSTSSDIILHEENKYDNYGTLEQKVITGAVSQTYYYYYKLNEARELDSIQYGMYIFKPFTDVNGRKTGREITYGINKIAGEYITYRKVGDHATNMPATVWFASGKNITDSIKYKYDSCGNISEILENGQTLSKYTYDGLNRLVREENTKLGKTTDIEYDAGGNILHRVVTQGSSVSCIDYDYVGDRLVSYDGKACSYNNIGIPISYRGKLCQWQYGTRLTKYGTTEFVYDGLGRRVKKDDITFTYDSDGRLIYQSNGLEFLYDASGVAAVKYNNAMYFYRKDAQGNIIAILDSNGKIVVKYVYDAWGDHTVSGSNTTLGKLNPFRYRSYYYDTETKLYYLQSRYYDPEVGRFISQDSIEYADPTTINGLNLYAYCGNNPIMGYDPTGTWDWNKVRDWFSTITGLLNPVSNAIALGTILVAAFQGRGSEIVEDWKRGCFNPFNQDPNVALKSNVFSFYKGESVVRMTHSTDGLQIFGTIFLGDRITSADTLNHEFGHGIQERLLGILYLTRVALPSVITYYVDKYKNIGHKNYYSMPWERTADWFGGVTRTFTYGTVTTSYKKGSLGWAIAENILGVGLIPWYFIFGY